MSDRPQSIPSTLPPRTIPSPLPEPQAPERPPADLRRTSHPDPNQQALRETVLWRFHRPQVAAAWRLVGHALVDLLNEAGEWGPEDGTPLTYAELRAACADLDHLAGYLDQVARERRASDLGEVAASLATEAGGWGDRLGRLVLDMRRALAEAAERLGAAGGTASPDPH